MAKNIWKIAGALVLVVVFACAAYEGWHYTELKGKISGAIDAEYGAIALYSDAIKRGKDLPKGVNYERILDDEKEHLNILSAYINKGSKSVDVKSPVNGSMLIQDEIAASKGYYEINKDINLFEEWLMPSLKDDIAHIYHEEQIHLNVLRGNIKGDEVYNTPSSRIRLPKIGGNGLRMPSLHLPKIGA